MTYLPLITVPVVLEPSFNGPKETLVHSGAKLLFDFAIDVKEHIERSKDYQHGSSLHRSLYGEGEVDSITHKHSQQNKCLDFAAMP